MIKILSALSALALCGVALYACADAPGDASATTATASSTGSAAPPRALIDTLNRIIPDEQPDDIRPAPITGFHEVRYGAQILYISDDGRYALQGDLLDLHTQQNVTEARRSEARIALLQDLDETQAITFSPAGEVKHVVHVFTDVDCTYCRQMHREMKTYNDVGIEIRYLAYPRSGPDSPVYQTMVSVWCAEDRADAMTRAKAGQSVPAATCPNPVREQYALANDFGVSGTPTLVLDDGSTLPGYVPADRLVSYLDAQAAGR